MIQFMAKKQINKSFFKKNSFYEWRQRQHKLWLDATTTEFTFSTAAAHDVMPQSQIYISSS